MEEIQHYIDQNGITFRLQAINEDGEIILQETSTLSFDDVAAYSGLLDNRFEALVLEAEESKDDDLVDAEVDESRSY